MRTEKNTETIQNKCFLVMWMSVKIVSHLGLKSFSRIQGMESPILNIK